MKDLKLNVKESRYKGFKVGQGVQLTYFTEDELELIRVTFSTLSNVRGKFQRTIKKRPDLEKGLEDLKHIIYKRTNFVPSDKNDKEFLDWCNNITKEGSVDYYKTLLNKTTKELEEEKGD